jgi:hypothetical protein
MEFWTIFFYMSFIAAVATKPISRTHLHSRRWIDGNYGRFRHSRHWNVRQRRLRHSRHWIDGHYGRLCYGRLIYGRLSYERLSYERLSYERLSYERLSYERLSYERLSYGRLIYSRRWIDGHYGKLVRWPVDRRLAQTSHRRTSGFSCSIFSSNTLQILNFNKMYK